MIVYAPRNSSRHKKFTGGAYVYTQIEKVHIEGSIILKDSQVGACTDDVVIAGRNKNAVIERFREIKRETSDVGLASNDLKTLVNIKSEYGKGRSV